MTEGPIDFGEEPVRERSATEFGGRDGLIQPSRAEVDLRAADGMEIGHDLTVSERAGIAARRAMVPLVGREQLGEVADDLVVDPVTGRVISDEEASVDVTGAVGREHALGDGVWQ